MKKDITSDEKLKQADELYRHLLSERSNTTSNLLNTFVFFIIGLLSGLLLNLSTTILYERIYKDNIALQNQILVFTILFTVFIVVLIHLLTKRSKKVIKNIWNI